MRGSRHGTLKGGLERSGTVPRFRLGVTALLALALLLPPTLLLGPASDSASAAAKQPFPVADDSSHQKVPGIGGGVVVWEDDRGGVSNIYGKKLGAGDDFLVATGVSIKRKPVTNGSVVVWEDDRGGDSDIYGYDIASQTEFLIASGPGDQRKPAISGNRVAWEDDRAGGGWELYSYDLASQQEAPVSTGAGNKTNVSIGEEFAVWQDDRNGSPDIYARDLATGREFRVTETGAELPAISGSVVVWQSSRNGSFDIFGKDLKTGKEFQVTTHESDQVSPSISGKTVVWRDGRNGNADIYGKDLESGEEFQIAAGPESQDAPRISGDTVVWETQRDGETNFGAYDIFGADLDLAPASPKGLSATGSLDGVALGWTGNSEADLAGYNVSRSESTDGAYTRLNDVPLTSPSYTDSQAPKGAKSHYRVTAVDDTGKESAAAIASSAAHALSEIGLSTNNSTVDSGESLELSGRLSSGEKGLSDKPVTLLKKPAGSSDWIKTEAQPAPTGADGGFSVAGIKPDKTTSYQARFAGETATGVRASVSPIQRVEVRIPTSLSLETSRATLVVGQGTTLSGKLSSEGNGLSGKRVLLLQKPAGASKFSQVPGQPAAGVPTASDGAYRLGGIKPHKNTLYRARFSGGAELRLSLSPIKRVNVRAKVIASVGSSGSVVSVGGRVVTAREGSVNVTIKKNGRIVKSSMVPMVNSRYRLAYRPSGAGRYTVTARFAKDHDNLGNVSPTKVFSTGR